MNKRTKDSSPSAKKTYLDRGISVCQGWQNFDNFYKDMGDKPSPVHSIDRINNEKGYSCGYCEECLKNNWPANCRWATSKEQANNRRSNILVEYKDQTKTLCEWSEFLKINKSTLYIRYKKGLRPPHLFQSDPLADRIKVLKNSWKIRRFSAEQVELIKIDFANGLTKRQVAKKYDAPENTIHTLVKAIYYNYPRLEDAIAYLTEKFKKQLDLNQVIDDNKT